MSSVGCLIPSDADIAGVGARISVYGQNLLCFAPAVWAIADGKVTPYELESMETLSTTNLVVAFGILISCFVQARTLGLSNFHGSIVLSMSWMNNTNVFIYFLLYAAQLKNQDGGWLRHLKNHVVSALHLRRFFPLGTPTLDVEEISEKKQDTSVTPPQTPSMRIRLFRRVALVLGSLHLTLMSALGVWLWSDPRGFGTADSACAVDHAHLAIAGARVPFSSNALRTFSLFIYGLFLVPGLNLLLPMAMFLGIYYLHGRLYPEAQQAESAEEDDALHAAQQRGTLNAKHTWSTVRRISSPKSPVFPAFIGLCFLLVINIVFIVDIELTLRNNRGIQESGEAEWGFGQVLAVLLLFLPLRDLVEMMFRRRQELQTQMDNALKRAINDKDIEGISKWATAGAGLDTKGDGNELALEVVCLGGRWEILSVLVDNGAHVDTPFRDGRTALKVAIDTGSRDHARIVMGAGADINALLKDGRTALEVATRESQWESVRILVELGAKINAAFKDGQTALEVTTHVRDWEGMRTLVGLGADLNAPFKDGQTALEAATRAGDWEGVRALVGSGADISLPFKDGQSALEAATRASDWEGVHALVGLGADINTLFKDGQTALEAATHAGDWERVRNLVGLGADINAPFKDGRAALEAATRAGEWEGVRALVGLGADINTPFKDGHTALEAATHAGDWERVHILVGCGADFEARFNDGRTALEAAAHARDWERVRTLVGCGADFNACFNDGQTPLDAATKAGDWEGVHALVGLGVRIPNGSNALRCAALANQWDLVLEIIDTGVDVNAPLRACVDDSTVLHVACGSNCRSAVIERLLQKGANVHAKDNEDRTSLHRACRQGRAEVVSLLLSNGADPHVIDDSDSTPLHEACVKGHDQCAELLLRIEENPVDPNVQMEYGWTPLHNAYEGGHQACIDVLLAYGADDTIKDQNGKTPPEMAPVGFATVPAHPT